MCNFEFACILSTLSQKAGNTIKVLIMCELCRIGLILAKRQRLMQEDIPQWEAQGR